MEYVAHFNDGSTSLIEVRGSYGQKDLIGVATRGDGKKRVLFFKSYCPRCRDPWIASVTACEAYVQHIQERAHPRLRVMA